MPRIARLAALALCIALAAGCSLFRPKTVLTVENKSQITQTISHVYAFASGGSSSLDVLAGSTIPYGSKTTILSQSFLAGTYTIRVVFLNAQQWNYTNVLFDGNPYTLTVAAQP